MGQHYKQLDASERNFLQSSLNKGHSQAAIALALQRSRSTISREIARNGKTRSAYDAAIAREAVDARRRRGPSKLREGSALRIHAFAHIRLGWSPQQISGKLKQMQDSDATGPKLPNLSHETIYRAIYVLPRGEIRKEIIGLLRQAKKSRGLRSPAKERRGGLIDMISIHDRPPEVLTREFPGDWEGDFVKGAGNASAIGTLIERKSRFTILAKMKDCGSEAALKGFTRALENVPEAMRKSLAYDQGKEMARHKELAKALNIKVYFCDPHSPWQRPGNENTNGLVRQYLPKGIDLSIYSQRDLDAIADSLNTRPRACLGFQTPEEVFNAEYRKAAVALRL
jgi:IS30 family transposase